MGKILKKIKDKTFYDPETSHNFLIFEMVGPIERHWNSQPLSCSQMVQASPVLLKKRESGLYKKQEP
jgi:hypothetical protein